MNIISLTPEERQYLVNGLVLVRAASDQLTMVIREQLLSGVDEADAMLWIFDQLCGVGGDPNDAMTKTAAFLFVQLAKVSMEHVPTSSL